MSILPTHGTQTPDTSIELPDITTEQPAQSLYSPITPEWDVINERELTGIDISESVYPLNALTRSTNTGNPIIDSDRVHARGSVWMYWEDELPDVMVRLADNNGSIRIRIDNSDLMDVIEEEETLFFKNLSRELDDSGEYQFVADEQSSVFLIDTDQRTALMDLSDEHRLQVTVNGYTREEFLNAFIQRANRLESELETRFPDVSVMVRNEGRRNTFSFRIRFGEVLLPTDIQYAFHTVWRHDGIRYMHDSKYGTVIEGPHYQVRL